MTEKGNVEQLDERLLQIQDLVAKVLEDQKVTREPREIAKQISSNCKKMAARKEKRAIEQATHELAQRILLPVRDPGTKFYSLKGFFYYTMRTLGVVRQPEKFTATFSGLLNEAIRDKVGLKELLYSIPSNVLAEFLLEEAKGEAISFLFLALKNGVRDNEVLAMLTDREGKVLLKKDKNGKTPLHWALVYGIKDIEELAMLIDSKKKVLQENDRYGRTPLHWALAKGIRDIEELAMLIDSEKKVLLQKDEEGKTPFHWAWAKGVTDATVLKMLVDEEAKVIFMLMTKEPRALNFIAENFMEKMTAMNEYGRLQNLLRLRVKLEIETVNMQHLEEMKKLMEELKINLPAAPSGLSLDKFDEYIEQIKSKGL